MGIILCGWTDAYEEYVVCIYKSCHRCVLEVSLIWPWPWFFLLLSLFLLLLPGDGLASLIFVLDFY